MFDMKSHEPLDASGFVAFCIIINLPVLRVRGGGDDVARLSKVEKEDLGFWINGKGEVEYHKRFFLWVEFMDLLVCEAHIS